MTELTYMKLGASGAEAAGEVDETGTICLRIQKNVELDDFENSHRPMVSIFVALVAERLGVLTMCVG